MLYFHFPEQKAVGDLRGEKEWHLNKKGDYCKRDLNFK